ncbi:NAD(P)/FAD-dependent oxidoreductase [Roseospira navarrensis]|uniref:FAD-dependent oxidoreductase n=1 Tax=Roseospira navarrensis TaxID=140058 RepID=A0A7X1ZG23_9PROT|nr:FAD-binding oxidoreductase [Roseospira navarrensis]MQX37805.1 FAD-dependent oxidoreductase [Roseospira navarrensis]
MTETCDVVVIGAGIAGASTAYHLRAEHGLSVRLIERGAVASGGTGQSAAIIRQHYSNALAAGLTRDSITLFDAMEQRHGRPTGVRRTGYRLLLGPDMLEGARRNVAMIQGLGIDTEILDVAALDLPWLEPDGIAGVVWEPDGGYADPVRATEAFVAAFQEAGGLLFTRTPVRTLLREGDRVFGVMTEAGSVHAGAVVNAAGPWAAPLAHQAGIALPVSAVREQDTVWEARSGRPLPDTPVSNGLEAIYLRPLGGRRFVVGRGFPKAYEPADPYNYRTTADEPFVFDVLARLERRLPSFQGATLVDSYAALYDVTPDWYPFAGPRRDVAGYLDCNGGSGHGFKLGPALGRDLAAWIATGAPRTPDFARLSHDRIADGRVFTQAYGGNRG